VITLKQPSLSFATDLVVGILPAEQAFAYRYNKVIPQDEFIGAGPFKLVRGGLGESRIVLKRFDADFAGPSGSKILEFHVLQDATLRALELLKGRIDLVQNALPAALVPLFQSKNDFKFVSKAGANFNYLTFNFRKSLFHNLKVRQAFAHALDVDGILKYKLPGLASRADSLLNPEHWAYLKNLGRYDYDPALAKTLLDEAGYLDPDGDGPKMRFDIIYKTSTDKQRLEFAQIFAANLREVGIGIEIRSYEFGTFMRDLKQGDFDIATLTWVGISDPDIYYPIAHSAQIPPTAPDGLNRGAYTDARMDKLLERSRAELDPQKRLTIFGKIQKKFFDDLVYVPLWYDHNFVVMKKDVIGYVPRVDSGFQNLKNVKK
jgi:peptide/nickel transport system substrate-binding protein